MTNIYKDIAERTNGDIYIGVVGPVRAGKSTFVTKFMERVVLPNISGKANRSRAIDELPQSADGKIIMTTQPNFVPNEAVKIKLGDKATANIRLIDCVGYLIEGVEGHMDGDKTRLVNTPWSSEPMPFERAAELGTTKVVEEHSSIAIVVTNDGSVMDIARSNYVPAEEKVIKKLRDANKPFVVVLNTHNEGSTDTVSLADALSEKYNTTVIPMDIAHATKEKFEYVLSSILGEFAVRRICFDMPDWMRTLDNDNWLISDIVSKVKSCTQCIDKMKQCSDIVDAFTDDLNVLCPVVTELDMGKGDVRCSIEPQEHLFYTILSQQANADISNQYGLMDFVVKSSYAKTQYDKIRPALEQAHSSGYGVVGAMPDNMQLCPPEIVKQGARFGVSLKATAPTLHIMRVDVSTEVSPTVGTEQQSQYLLNQFESNPEQIWSTNMFGKSLSDIVQEGLAEKCDCMADEIKSKLVRTATRIVNEGKGGLICLLL